jgi:dinuclear metal center YbgI/SA1388 family protein
MNRLSASALRSPLTSVTTVLGNLFPLSLAATWDNVGLLIEPQSSHDPVAEGKTFDILFTNDVTPLVLADAMVAFSGGPPRLIVSYHPIPFRKMNRFTLDSPAARVIMDCAAAGIALYSPHTAWDAAPDGLNTWLLDGIAHAAGARLSKVEPVQRAAGPAGAAGAGDGRVGVFETQTTLATVIDAVKAHLHISHVQVALPASLSAATAAGADAVAAAAATHGVSSIAVCAGSGAGVLGDFRGADVWVTGELAHHDVLAASAAGVAVILTQHSRCERGFLAVVQARLGRALIDSAFEAEVTCKISAVDADPLTTL